MGHLTGKTVIVTGGGRAVLHDGRCGSIGYGIATAFAKETAAAVEHMAVLAAENSGSGAALRI